MTKTELEDTLNAGVDAWHADVEDERSLPDYLGITQAEYDLWLRDPLAALDLIHARKYPQ